MSNWVIISKKGDYAVKLKLKNFVIVYCYFVTVKFMTCFKFIVDSCLRAFISRIACDSRKSTDGSFNFWPYEAEKKIHYYYKFIDNG